MAAKMTKKKAIAGKTAKQTKAKQAAPKKKTAAKAKAVQKKAAVASKAGTKAKRKSAKKLGTKNATAPVSKLTKAEKAARRRKLALYRRLLDKKMESLLQAYNISKSNTRIESRDGTEDYIDYAVSSYHRDFTLSLTEMDRQQMKLVEQALVRLRRREFGTCQHCSAVIPERRLEVEPWARHCITCQELDEQGLLEPPDFEEQPEDDIIAAPEQEPDVDEDDADEEPIEDEEEAVSGTDDDKDDEDDIDL